uniref:ubiquitin-associated domain-containing protein 1-like n=1 Tax=Styela clava TaxID=7725 RepID=UPI0019395B86|nr:ubiquitin-associated domain-containing protein 1-like [Styela clava]
MYKESGPSNFAINVFSMQGHKVLVDAQTDMSIESVKNEAVKKLSNMRGSGFDNTAEYTLVCAVGQCRRLFNKNTIKSENLTAADILLLYNVQEQSSKDPGVPTRSIPTMPGIKKATEGLVARGKSVGEAASSANSATGTLEQTFRKILLTLLDLSYKLMFFDEEADGLFCSKSKTLNLVDPSLISSLTAMGFSEAMACKALRVNQMDMEAAMDWLLHNPESREESAMDTDTETDENETEDKDDDKHSAKRVKRRLDAWRKKNQRLQPSNEHITILVGMGFTKEDSTQALKLNGNNPSAACDWLLGDRKVPDDDPNDGLAPDSELYKAIVSNPTIHIGLHNKRVLEALEDMLENPLRRHNWANDSTVGSVILQILKLYHKYSNSG